MQDYPNNTRKIDPLLPEEHIIAQAADMLREGGIVVFPTTCLYGMAADAFNPEAVNAVFRIKNRLPDNPLLILIQDKTVLKDVAETVPPDAIKLMDRFWPGKITIILKASSDIPDNLTGGTGKIGVRIPGHPVATALVNSFKHPITGTSANISTRPGCADIASLSPEIKNRAGLILDAGPLKGGSGSTVIDVSEKPYRLIREGAISKIELANFLKTDLAE